MVYIVFLGLLAITFIMIFYNLNTNKSALTVDNRKCALLIERKLYKALTKHGYYVRTKFPCGKYRIDLALPRYKIAIECNGKEFQSIQAQKLHDHRKHSYLKQNGWKVLRFRGTQINGQLEKVMKKIKHEVKVTTFNPLL